MKHHKIALIGAALALMACSKTPTSSTIAASSACDRLPDAKGAVQKLYEPGKVYAASEVKQKRFIARALQPQETVGADMYLHADEGMTRQYVERVLTCHAAFGTPAHPNDPLHPSAGAIADVSVRSAGDSLAIRVIGDGPKTGRDIAQRARSLAGGRGQVTVDQVAKTESNAAF